MCIIKSWVYTNTYYSSPVPQSSFQPSLFPCLQISSLLMRTLTPFILNILFICSVKSICKPHWLCPPYNLVYHAIAIVFSQTVFPLVRETGNKQGKKKIYTHTHTHTHTYIVSDSYKYSEVKKKECDKKLETLSRWLGKPYLGGWLWPRTPVLRRSQPPEYQGSCQWEVWN